MTCPYCKAEIREQADTGFHATCYRKWLSELYRELRHASVPLRGMPCDQQLHCSLS